MEYRKKFFDIGVLSLFLFLSIFSFYGFPRYVFSASATHLVISEVQISGVSATDEFVELYNPTNETITMENYRLVRLTSSGTQATLVSSLNASVPSRSYFLIKHPDSSASADLEYSAASNSIASNATVILLASDLITQIDKVGLGSAEDSETVTVANPPIGGSVERKANTSSTIESMTIGIDISSGNGEDSNNNHSDFVVREIADPQNSTSTQEPLSAPSPLPSADPSPSLAPSSSPSITPSPSLFPSPSPTLLPLPSPTLIPSPVPSIEPSPIVTPRPEPIFNRVMVCGWTVKTIKSSFWSFSMPIFGCKWITAF